MNPVLQTVPKPCREAHEEIFSKRCWSLCLASIVLAGSTLARTCAAATVTYDTGPYWPNVSAILGGMGPEQSSTIGQTFVAPAGPSVALNDFSFIAESYFPLNGGVANLHLRAFVYSWAGNITGHGGGAVGSPLYLGPSFVFSPPPRPGGWVPLTANIGGSGLTLNPGQHYVMGFTLSDPADYAASQGDIEFQVVPHRPGVDYGSGGAVWLNNGNNFAALNTAVWDTWGDIGAMAFTAHFTVVPEPSTIVLAFLATGLVVSRSIGTKGRRSE